MRLSFWLILDAHCDIRKTQINLSIAMLICMLTQTAVTTVKTENGENKLKGRCSGIEKALDYTITKSRGNFARDGSET